MPGLQHDAQPVAAIHQGVFMMPWPRPRPARFLMRLVKRARDQNGWYGVANVLMGSVSVIVGLILLLMSLHVK